MQIEECLNAEIVNIFSKDNQIKKDLKELIFLLQKTTELAYKLEQILADKLSLDPNYFEELLMMEETDECKVSDYLVSICLLVEGVNNEL